MERSTVHLLHKRGKSLRQIASELGRSKKHGRPRAERARRSATDWRRRKSSVDAFREQIAEWLKQGLSGVRMMELAREDPEHPYGGCGSVWRAAVRRERLSVLHEQAVADVPIRFEGLPGEYLQVDWGEIRHFPFTQQTPVTRYFLACRLEIQPLDVGDLHRQHAPGDVVPRAGGVLQRAGLRAVGAGVRLMPSW